MKQKVAFSYKILSGLLALSLVSFSCTINDTNDDEAPVVAETAATFPDETTIHNDSVNNIHMAPADNTATEIVPVKPNPAKKGLKGKISSAPEMPAKADAKMMPDAEGFYPVVDIMASFPEGNKGLQKYFDRHLEYPIEANNEGIEGTVRISFVVDENGKLQSPKILGNNIGYGLETEALRVINKMPAWNPAMVKGKAVKTRLVMPVKFELN